MGVYIGIDLALKAKHEACLETSGGKKKRFRFSNVPSELLNFLKWVKGQQEEVTGFVMEPTGAVWIPLARCLTAHGYTVFLLKTEKAHALRQFYRKHTKTDKIDALMLAKAPVVDPQGIFPYQFLDNRLEKLKRLVKVRDRRTVAIAQRKLEIQAILDLLLPGWRQCFKGRAVLGKAVRVFLREYADLRKVKILGHDAFQKALAKVSSGQGWPKIESLYTLILETSLFYEHESELFFETIQQELILELDLLEAEEKQVSDLDSQIRQLYLNLDTGGSLESHVGIGPKLAPTILAFTGAVSRFRNQREYRSFCGLCPRKCQSGSHESEGLRMTKAGPAPLKHAFYLAAEAARKFDPEFARVYHRLRKKGKHHNKIMGALAAKMATRVFAVMKRQSKNSEPRTYRLRDLSGQPISRPHAIELIHNTYGKNLKEAKKKTEEERLKTEAVFEDSSRCLEASSVL